MRIHKFNAGEKGEIKVYVVKDDSNASFVGKLNLGTGNWVGSTAQNISQVLSKLDALSFSKEIEAPKEEKKPAKGKRHASIESAIEQLEKVAADIQAEGNLEIAKALDWVSDIIENKVQ